MKTTEFPLIISPNLGCPEIVSVKELKGKTIPLIVAGQYGEFVSPLKEIFEGAFYLRPSDGSPAKIPLCLKDEPKEITSWNLLSEFSDTDATREIINSELHYEIFGEETRYWKINVYIKDDDYTSLSRNNGEKDRPKLFDLVFTDKSKKCEKVNYHSIQFVSDFEKGVNFIHLTDLHTAKRNDEILDEVLKKKSKSKRSRKEIEASYINFNDKLREFIREANKLADNGKLDFVVITGDLVDFAFHGWEDEPNVAENNWKIFINIVTGAGKEKEKGKGKEKGNPGIKVAIFTSTGNHDWRLHPYDPRIFLKLRSIPKIILNSIRKLRVSYFNEKFGLYYEELKHYDYKAFDSIEYPEDDWTKLSREVRSNAFKKLNFGAFADKGIRKLEKYLSLSISSKFTPWVLRVIPLAGIMSGIDLMGGIKLPNFEWVIVVIISVIAFIWGLLEWPLKKYIKKIICKLSDIYIYLPIHAEAKALHYYLKHINPYFDYAFQIGGHSFIVMDTGADFFVRQFLEGKTIKDINKLSLEDNILGGSPDSMAFDPEQNYYNWSQIVWLEKVLSVPDNKDIEGKGNKRSFIFLHAPPINPPKEREWSKLWESERQDPKWIPKDECNLTYGSINYYLSQFFYLSMGYRESELVKETVESNHKKVDLVFSGHAHRNIEFRLKEDEEHEHEIRIYSDVYSKQLREDAEGKEQWWNEHRPVIVQTAACGLKGKNDKVPPYFRKVALDSKGNITDFSVWNIEGVVSFNDGGGQTFKKHLKEDACNGR